MRTVRIGCGAGYSGDRIEPAVELARDGDLDYLVFECLAERTIAIAQQAKTADPNAGYDPLLRDRMAAVLPICADARHSDSHQHGRGQPDGGGRRRPGTRPIARSRAG